jgi:hypothetical protein
MPKRETTAPGKSPADPDALVRQSAGEYRSGDGRFTVRQADVGWFVVDNEQANEFGQELIHGPFSTLKAARGAVPASRTPKRPTPIRRQGRTTPRANEPPPPPPSWIDQLPLAEGRHVRRLITALEREGVSGAEELVKRDRDGLLPAVAVELIERRLAAAVAELPKADQPTARAFARRVGEILSADGSTIRDPLPGWVLLEVAPGDDPPEGRRIDLRR